MIDARFVFESIKRKWKIILVLAICAVLLGYALSLPKTGSVAAPSYTAEATIYLDGMYSDKVNEFNYSLNEGYLTADAKRVILSDSVAGEVRRQLGEDVKITSPTWTDRDTKKDNYSHFVFIDATADSEELAIKSASLAAEKAVAAIEQNLNVQKVHLFEDAKIKTTGESVADYGTDDLEVSPFELASASFNFKKFILVVGGGLFAAVFICILWEIARRGVRSAHDVERVLGLPLIGVVSSRNAKGSIDRIAAALDLYADHDGQQKAIVCDLDNLDNAQLLSEALSVRVRRAKVSGFLSLMEVSNDYEALLDADVIVVSVNEKNRVTGKDIDSSLEFLALAETPILGAVYVKTGALER